MNAKELKDLDSFVKTEMMDEKGCRRFGFAT